MAIPITLLYLVLSMLSPADLIPELYPYRPMIILTGLALLAGLLSALQDLRSLALPQLPLLLGFYFMLCASRLLTGWVGGAYEAIFQFSVQFVTFFMILISANSERKIRWVGRAILFVAFYYFVRCWLAMDFHIDADRFTVEQWAGWDPIAEQYTTLRRAAGLGYLADPNDLSQFYLVAMPFLWLGFRKRNFVWNIVFVLLPTAILIYGLYQTASRGSLVGLFVLLALALKRKLGFGGPILSAGFAAFLLLVVGYGGGRVVSVTSDSGGGRVELWSDALGLWRGSPIWGIGFDTITREMPLTAHNAWVLCLTELGVVGNFFWVGLLVVSVVQMRRVMAMEKSGPEGERMAWLANTVFLSLAAWMATGWFLSNTYTVSLYALLGLTAAVWAEARRRLPDLTGMSMVRTIQLTLGSMVACYITVYILIRFRWAG